jgi:hypothetical protein
MHNPMTFSRFIRCLSVGIVVFAATWLGPNVRQLLAEDISSVTADWLRSARIAGAELFSEMTDREITKNLLALADQNVSVIEADSDLSRMLTDREFAAEIALMRRYSEAAHRFGMKVVWYYPALEVLTPNATRGNRTMSQMHPSWIQLGVGGKPNVFIGGKRSSKARVHWVDPGTESAWMSPHSPYADMFLDRIRQIAATGVDGIWLDVPLYNDIAVPWADTAPGAAAKFQADTGVEIPKKVDWKDPSWRRWIAWRHQQITDFIYRVRDAANSVANDIALVVETVTLDYGAATILGLDGSTMKTAPGVIQVWELDAVSDRTAMRDALPDDWISLIAMSKFAKAASGTKPSWIFTYGKEPDDAMLVLAEALATGNHPYETKIPLMTTTVGAVYRKRVFSWIKQEERRLFSSDSAATVAVYFSPESRDYVDKGAGSGLFATTKSKDVLWWSNEQEDSVYSLTYLAEYRGIIKWLVHNHVPFDIVVRPDAGELSRYETVLAPSLVALSDAEAELLDRYVAAGGNLIVTGPNPATLDELGNERNIPILVSLARLENLKLSASVGERLAVHNSELVGKAYLTSGSPAAGHVIGELVKNYVHSLIETDADKNVHIELRTLGDERLLHLINRERLWNKKAPTKRDVTIRLALAPGTAVANVRLTSPDASPRTVSGAIGADLSVRPSKAERRSGLGKQAATIRNQAVARTSLPFTVAGNRVSFTVPLEAYEMVVVSTKLQDGGRGDSLRP